MNKEYFKKYVKHFTLKEVNRVSKGIETIDPEVLMRLDDLRHILGVPIKITELNKGKHVEKSYHTRGVLCQAVDFKVLGNVPKNKVLQEMLDCGFTGIGVYHGFYHGDIRLEHKLWRRKKGVYLPLI